MILTKYLTNLGQMWPNTYCWLGLHIIHLIHQILANFSPDELVFERTPKVLLNLDTTPDIKVSDTFKDYHELLNKRL